MKKILVTGAGGLVGYELVNRICQNHKVYVLARKNPGFDHENVNYINCDLSNGINQNELPEEIDVIYHLAQSENFRLFPEKAIDVFSVNTTSTLLLLDYARTSGCAKFIYASSGGVYGGGDNEFNESDILPDPAKLGFYASSKACSEIIVNNYSNLFDVVVSRFFFVYGKRQTKTMLIPRLIENVRKGNSIGLQGAEGLIINPIHVEDAAKALEKMIDLSGSHTVNIGGAESLSLKNICDIIGGLVSSEPLYEYSDASPNNLIGDIAKMKELLVEPEISMKEGIQKMI